MELAAKPGNDKPYIRQPASGNTEGKNPETGMPFIKSGDGRQGWDAIRDRRDKAEEGDTLDIDMNGSAVVPGDVLRGIKGKDITMTFDLGNGILWSVNGKGIMAEAISDVDFSVATGTEAIPAEIVNGVEAGGADLSEGGNNGRAPGNGYAEGRPEKQPWNIAWAALIIAVVAAAGFAIFFVRKKKKGEEQ